MLAKHAVMDDVAKKNSVVKSGEQELQIIVLVCLGKELVKLLQIIVVLCFCTFMCNVYHVLQS